MHTLFRCATRTYETPRNTRNCWKIKPQGMRSRARQARRSPLLASEDVGKTRRWRRSAACSPKQTPQMKNGRATRGRSKQVGKSADKPGSVEVRPPKPAHPGNHSSASRVAATLKQPTREQREPRHCPPIWPCPGWGLPCRSCCQSRGGLLHDGAFAPPEISLTLDFTPFHPYLCPEEQALRLALHKGLCRLAAAKSEPSAVCSLLHFPSPHGARPLAGILLCGARTFLHAPRGAQRLPGELPEADYTLRRLRRRARKQACRRAAGRCRWPDRARYRRRCSSPAPGSARCWPDTSDRPDAGPTADRPPRRPRSE